MQVFLSHNTNDKDIVEAIGSFLEAQGLTVWIDSWRMTAGDSLVEKIGEGIESSDRLIVFLSPNSVDSKWVRKEVATGLVMELAEDKGLGEKFVVPALLTPCKVPIMLRDKLYANFTNKSFDSGCQELLAGILDEPAGHAQTKLENRIVRIHVVPRQKGGAHALLIEFGCRISPVEGLHIGVDVGASYDQVLEWFGPPGQDRPPSHTGGVFTNSATRREPPIYARKFSSPGVTSTRSFYLFFQGPEQFMVKDVQYLDYYNRTP